MKSRNILVLYCHYNLMWRSTNKKHTFFLAINEGRSNRITFLNVAFSRLRIPLEDFSSVVLTTSFLSQKWQMNSFKKLEAKTFNIQRFAGPIFAMPQDEFINTAALDDFFDKLQSKNVHIFSLLPKHEWSSIYPKSFKKGIQFEQVLAGYFSKNSTKTKNKEFAKRKYLISYRAWHAEPWLGIHGKIKIDVAEEFCRAKIPGTNISTEEKEMIEGWKWERFLQNSKFSLGVEGGASISDPIGEIREKVDLAKKREPNLSWQEIYESCDLQSYDQSLDLKVITPRIFEYIENDTAMILVEGYYNGILQPKIHYIPISKDYSNIHEIIPQLTEKNYLYLTSNCRKLIENRSLHYRFLSNKIINATPLNSNRVGKRVELSILCTNLSSYIHRIGYWLLTTVYARISKFKGLFQ